MTEVFIHPLALCESSFVGAGTCVAPFCHIEPGAKIGENCSIQDHVYIGSNVIIGDRVIIQQGARVSSNVFIEDDVFIGCNVSFSRLSKVLQWRNSSESSATYIRQRAKIYDNATVFSGVTIGSDANVGAGTVVQRDIQPKGIAEGNPARIVGYVDTTPIFRNNEYIINEYQKIRRTTVRGVTLHSLRNVLDVRGNLTAAEFGEDVPFDAKRFFLINDVPSVESRGEHAHFRCAQFLIAVKGSLHVVADDGARREEFVLDKPTLGLFLPPMVWGIQYRYSFDAVLLVIASEHYDSGDYIRDYDDFLNLTRSRE